MIGLYAAIEAGGTHVHTIKGRAEAWPSWRDMTRCRAIQVVLWLLLNYTILLVFRLATECLRRRQSVVAMMSRLELC
jgi:hypothetical protein